ncbi:hypothetical protein Q73_05305 [Bacillus coahuilensis m2-6]|uniref:hypothetical protein n=1 Tax=Bacillus coahuilensis TaxID=408580 RepID=UPI0007503375|nr:hypothetical protein [Bacillus coahuilensis]KUP08609.1 hypothetical protein Q73_05305 [Bacillus coahuilensis m2-6]
MLQVILTVVSLFTIYFAINSIVHLKKTMVASKSSYFPNEPEMKSILFPNEWEQMEPVNENSSSYKWVIRGNLIAIVMTIVIYIILLKYGPVNLSTLPLFLYIITTVFTGFNQRVRNLYIVEHGLIVKNKLYNKEKISFIEIEKIIKWHPLYGLSQEINNGYRIKIVKRLSLASDIVVITEDKVLDRFIKEAKRMQITVLIQEAVDQTIKKVK